MADITPFTDADVEAVALDIARETCVGETTADDIRRCNSAGHCCCLPTAELVLSHLSARLRETNRRVITERVRERPPFVFDDSDG